MEELSRRDILEYIRQQRPDTKWVVHLLTNVTFYLNKLIQHPIGARVVLPDFFLRNQGLVCLAGGAHGPYEDNLCFFSVHGSSRCQNLRSSIQYVLPPVPAVQTDGFQGVYLDDLMVSE